ncbi:hypothetical protein LX99_01469 [Mucilaginibacter oryzae]|uniref:Cytochrome oxidase complex assembly protein 1 n=1 Tax=Mucilaginibacter oryzae TaxID=468058 RepID=A0A316HLB5_9SPHI|nr:hypothetical protein [Mucilaginibacter oryzae]PWK79015.1 hypothetical protein LX99_01469 [Mucilaginibacter oryzae]
MDKTYLKDKHLKKKRAMKGVYAIVVAAIVFVFIMVKFATSGGVSDILSFGKMPNADDAYSVAKEFVIPTIKSTNVSFPDDGFQFGKKSDSVYIIKSYVISTDGRGEKNRTNFEMILKYNGGPPSMKKNWSVVDINESTQ